VCVRRIKDVGGLDERPFGEVREAALEVVERLALVGQDAGDVHEASYLVRVAGDGDHGAVGSADEHDGSVELVEQRRRIGTVVRNPTQEVGGARTA